MRLLRKFHISPKTCTRANERSCCRRRSAYAPTGKGPGRRLPGIPAGTGPGNGAPPHHIPFTPRAKKVLELSLREALALGDNYIGMEHVALALLRVQDGVVPKLLANLQVSPDVIRAALLDQHRKAS